MVCGRCGKEMRKIGTLSEAEKQELWFINEKVNCAYQAINSDVIREIEFSEGQVFDYFRAAYDSMAQARFLQHVFYSKLRERLRAESDVSVDELSGEVFVHPDGGEEA